MVAFTPIYDLPYAEGTDPPCFGPGAGCDNLESVWCDFVQLVEAQLDTVDNVIGRTETAIPMAKVSWFRSPAELIIGPVPFDTVVFDTDNMMDIDNTMGITPRRDGVYGIDFRMACEAQAANQFHDVHITIGTESEPSSSVTVDGVATATTRTPAPGGNNPEIRASTLYRFTSTTPNPRIIVAVTIFSPVPPTASSASMLVYWHSDF